MHRSIIVTIALLAFSPVQAAPADVDRLGWIAGDWILEEDGTVTRETWLPPLGGAMAGVTQTNRPGQPPTIEFATITDEPAGVTFTARVSGEPPTAFVLRSDSDIEAVFENQEHDFPQRVIYRRCEEDLCARIEGVVDGTLKNQEWRYSPF
jgi:hypothetical protein